MRDSFEELTTILVPPAQPSATGTPEAWRAVEQRIGSRLPIDYKRFIDTYGVGSIADVVWILSPFEPRGRGTVEERLASHREMHAMGFVANEPDGLIPWAENNDRATCFWETRDPDPDRWTVLDIVDDYFDRWPENMSTFLLKVLKGEHPSELFYRDTRFTLPLEYKAWTPRPPD